MRSKFFTFFVVFMLSIASRAQSIWEPAPTFNKKRTIGVSTGGAIAWGGTISALGFVWYSNFEKSPFHFFDDSHEWNQMDKMGHLYIANHVADFIAGTYRWSGLSNRKASLIGSLYSFGYMTTFEMLDAYNTKWGFSWSDMGFNTLGSSTYFFQQYYWDKEFVHLKFTSHQSGLAQYRPNVLGSDYPSRLLKDYNGQTYWASFNPFEWFNSDPVIPKWINFSLGYSTNDQLIGDGDTYTVIDGAGVQQSFTPYRQLFFSLDVNWEAIETDVRFLKVLFKGLNYVKVPFPALELSRSKLAFRPLYF